MRVASVVVLALVGAWLALGGEVEAREAPTCSAPRFADVGWTDITATTALASRMLEGIGYAPKTQILSVPVTYVSMKNKDIDIFLGNWMPTMAGDRQPYLDDKSIEVVGANLQGAKYTLAVPSFAYQAGLRSFGDIARFREQLGGKIYALEPGNDGNRTVLSMIQGDKFGLKSFELVESSEQGMLAQVDRAIRHKQPIVFLGWEPHPMNQRFQMNYLDDATDTFGPENGGATIYTNVRTGYLEECPNIGKFLTNLKFQLSIEDTLMAAILQEGKDPSRAAEDWLKANPDAWPAWLDGVTALDGGSALSALRKSVGLDAGAAVASGSFLSFGDHRVFNAWFAQHKIPLGAWLNGIVEFATKNGQIFFDLVSLLLGTGIAWLTAAMIWLPPPLLILLFAGGAYALHRSIGLSIFIVLSLFLVVDLGYWTETVQTLSLVFSATSFCIIFGVPIGIAAAHRPWLYKAIRPLLDLMQTIPTFVYLIPTLILFGLGVVPGLISTVIFSIPAPIRLTHLGICGVPKQLREAGEAFGATKRQLLFKIELPHALPTIMAGITQCIMLSLSMVVIAALVGADGLGQPVERALNSVNVVMGFESGLAIVVLAIILDRVCKSPEPKAEKH
jgi:glycine betaine/proline transport system substrate-binding protein